MAGQFDAPPGLTAAYDQAKAGSDVRLDALLEAIRRHTDGQSAPFVALAVTATLAGFPEAVRNELLTTAVLRLLDQGPS
jgi:hypothetical protein